MSSLPTKLIRPLVFGACNTGAVYLALGKIPGTFRLNPFGALKEAYPVPGLVAAFGIGAASSIIVDLVHDYVLSHVPQSAAWQSRELLALNAASGAGGMLLLSGALNPDGISDVGVTKLAAAGAGASVLGAYLDSFIEGRQNAY